MPSIQGVTPARHIPLLNRSRFVINNQQPEATSATSTESPAPTIRDGASAAGHRPPVLHSNVASPQEPPGATAAVSNTAVASPVDAVSRDSTTLDAGDDAPKPIERDDLAPPPNAAAGTAPSSVRTPEPASESNTTKAAHEPSEIESRGSRETGAAIEQVASDAIAPEHPTSENALTSLGELAVAASRFLAAAPVKPAPDTTSPADAPSPEEQPFPPKVHPPISIELRWVLRDVRAGRLRAIDVSSPDIRLLANYGLIELRDGVPILTVAGVHALNDSPTQFSGR